MKLYIDTCVISGHAKGELTPNETAAFNRLLGQYASGEITLVTSTVAKDELNRIPMEYRASHEQVYQRLKEIPAAGYLVLDLGFGVPALGVKTHPVYRKLAAILADENDAKHIYQAVCEEAWHFITVDRKTILSRAPEVFGACKVEALSPSEFLVRHA